MAINKTNLCILIPARMGSSRLYGKPLKKIGDLTLIERVYKNCTESKLQSNVIVATDSDEILNFCEQKKITCIMTKDHNCGSSRIAEVARQIKEKWILEVQGDEPFLYSNILDQWAKKCQKLIRSKYSPDLFLAYVKINYAAASNKKFVKLILNRNKEVLWASRSKIPSDYKGIFQSTMYRHTGVHLWKRTSLIKFGNFKRSKIELSEDTHSIRMVENKLLIKGIPIIDTQAIDIPRDLVLARKIVRRNEKK